MTWDQHSPEPRPGLALYRRVTCGCRTHDMLLVLALVAGGIRVAVGLTRPGTWVRPLTDRPPYLRDRPREPGEHVYSFSPDGMMLFDLHYQRFSAPSPPRSWSSRLVSSQVAISVVSHARYPL
ncbi:MAG TPA: hypothetical protein VFQ44_17275 [Streptosporangiaceae bacterium]|nr:hypothetical protein [Streptosporangiaceae bacterium]